MKFPPLLAALSALVLGGCDFAPRYAAPIVALPAKFDGYSASGVDLSPDQPWWRSFDSATLNSLEVQIDAANPDLAAAIAANDASQAVAQEAVTGLFPQLDGVGHVTANKQSADRPLRSSSQPNYYGDNLLGGQVAFEVDIWGRIRDIAKAAAATAEASTDALAQARLELHAELARDYINLRGLDDEIRLLNETIRVYRSALDLTKTRLAAQIASPVDVDRAQTQLSSAEADASDLALRRVRLVNAIATLTGKPSPSYALPRATTPMRSPPRPRAVPTDVLRRRPDVSEAERLTAAANQYVGAARANFLPRISFLALGGTQDTGFRLLNPVNALGTIGPAFTLPIFDAGLREAELKVAKADFTQQAELYRSVVLRAVKEVDNSLASIRWLAAEYAQTSTASKAAQDAARLSMTLYRDGASSFLDVVTAQSAALDQQRLAIALHTRELEANVELMLALGGGWMFSPSPPPEPDLTPVPIQFFTDQAKAKP